MGIKKPNNALVEGIHQCAVCVNFDIAAEAIYSILRTIVAEENHSCRRDTKKEETHDSTVESLAGLKGLGSLRTCHYGRRQRMAL